MRCPVMAGHDVMADLIGHLKRNNFKFLIL